MTTYTQEYIETLLAASHDPILILDGKYKIRKANLHFYTLFNLDQTETEGRLLFDIANKSWDIPEVRNLLSRILPENLGAENYEVELDFPGNEHHSFLINARQAAEKFENSELIFLVIEDITEHKMAAKQIRQAELERQESEDRFRVIADSAPVLIWLSGTDRLRYFFNRGWLDFTGHTMAQEVGNGWAKGVHPDDSDHCLEVYGTNFDARQEFYMEYRLKKHDGTYRWISDKGVPRYDAEGNFSGFVGGCMDIDDQKNFAEQLEIKVRQRTKELELSRSFLNSILNSTYYGIASYEPMRDSSGAIADFRITYSNPEVPSNFGLTVADVSGKTCREIYPGIFDNGVFEKMVACMKSGKPDTYEIDVPLSDRTIWLSAAIEKVNDSVTVTSKNITKEKEAALHLEQMNELLNNKNKELASFTYIASHDLQEPLRKIQMFASRILENDKNTFTETSLAHFHSIGATANRMQHLIDAVLSYSSMDSEKVKMEKTDLNKLLKDVLALMDNTLDEKSVTVERNELPTLRVMPIQFQQLFLNILNNAVKYSKPDVKPVIKVRAEKEVSEKQKFWKISISDNGIGFESQYSEKIFEVFQRLHGKKEYVGTGVGLAICQKIVKNHNGYITADGEPGVGATFNIYLPTKE